MNTQYQKVLFIGNSLTSWNKGIHYHIDKMVNSGEIGINLKADSVVKPGADLKKLWEKTEARNVIKSGEHNIVVLQEDIPETDIKTFQEHVRSFKSECDKNKIRLILYMAWPYERLNWITTDEIACAHFEIAKELNIEIAPVALAWEKVKTERPEINLFDDDKEHPSLYGTYLATNVIFSTIFNLKAIEYSCNHGKAEISAEEKEYLKNVAWQETNKLRNQFRQR